MTTTQPHARTTHTQRRASARWTHLEPRALPAQLMFGRVFARVAPAQVQALDAAVAARLRGQSEACAHALRASLSAVGARALAHLTEAIGADIAAHDWDTVDARMTELRRHVAVVLHAVASARP